MVIVDSYSETNKDSSDNLIPSSQTAVGQSFTGDGGVLNSAKFYLYRNSSPTGNAYAKIYSHTGTFGTSSLPGSLLATSDAVDITTISDSVFELITFTFSGAEKITLINGTKYVVVIESDNGDESNWIDVGTDVTSPTHYGNISRYFAWSPPWEADATDDMCFYVYRDDSPFDSPSLSPSASGSPSESPSLSPSASESPSESPSLSPSTSESPSESLSASPSISPSASPSASPSESLSLSPSASASPSESPSLSPSASESPSASPSLSPSASESPSISPSVSPSPGAGFEGPLSPGTVVNDNTPNGTVEWTNPDNAKVSDDTFAIVTLGDNVRSYALKATNFGFDIPTGATIAGILAEVEIKFDEGVGTINAEVELVKNGVFTATYEHDITVTSTLAYCSHGSSSDLWGDTWIVDDINNAGFGLALWIWSSVGKTWYVDHIRITVYFSYASPSPSVSPSLSPSASFSPSASESPSASPSESPSESPSISPSASESPSESPSASPSESPSVSPSESPSESPSVSPSVSPSPSPPVYNAYILDGQSLPRPKSFSREFISIARDVRTIDGKEGRDMSHRKERYILGWDTLSAYNVSRILTIIDKDVAVTFAISEENLTILSTNVLVKLVSIDYITPGENYLAELVIELLEVE